MYGTCSAQTAAAVTELGGIPIDYQHQDFVEEIRRLTGGAGVDVVFDGIGGTTTWRSRQALRPGGRVVAFGLTGSLRGGRSTSGPVVARHRYREMARFVWYMIRGSLFSGRRRVVIYSIQWLKRIRPSMFRQDLMTLFSLLQQKKIKPLVARRLPLVEARHAQELLGSGGVTGKIVLVLNGSSTPSAGASPPP
jgi:NADPH2:quinone reductase